MTDVMVAARSTAEVVAIARVAHEANRAYSRIMGDLSQMEWDYAEQWQRDSAIAGVRKILDGRIGTPREAHESWLQQKVEEGWTFGAVKDSLAKTHPCLVAYVDLPPDQQRKDALFFAVVNALR